MGCAWPAERRDMEAGISLWAVPFRCRRDKDPTVFWLALLAQDRA